MDWFLKNDHTPPVITAQGLQNSAHGERVEARLPETCVLFEIGMAMGHLEKAFETEVLLKRLPCLLYEPHCAMVKGIPEVCFVKGGYGAPAAVDTLEMLIALGVKRLIVAGMLGAFAEDVRVCDVVIPERMFSEEGTSRHYAADMDEGVCPDAALHKAAVSHFSGGFRVWTSPAVSTDAVYRQTFGKERIWRERGYAGVDMESSALLAVCRHYRVPAVTLLIASDKHPMHPGEKAWDWGGVGFQAALSRFVEACVAFAGTYDGGSASGLRRF